jgi:hypothetical protein
LVAVSKLNTLRAIPRQPSTAWPAGKVIRLLEYALAPSAAKPSGLNLEPDAGTSYRHPNGFVKIPLAQHSSTGMRLTLHVWDDNYVDGDIHNHRWPFSSRILLGSLTNILYRHKADNTFGELHRPLAVYEYVPAANGKSYSLTATGAIVNAVEYQRSNYHAGQVYSMTPPSCHIAATGIGTVTLMSRGQIISDRAQMWLRSSDVPASIDVLENTVLSDRERTSVIVDVLHRLSKRIEAERERN